MTDKRKKREKAAKIEPFKVRRIDPKKDFGWTQEMIAENRQREPKEGELSEEEAKIPLEERIGMTDEVRAEAESQESINEFLWAEAVHEPTLEEIWYGFPQLVKEPPNPTGMALPGFAGPWQFIAKIGDRYFGWKGYNQMVDDLTESPSWQSMIEKILAHPNHLSVEFRKVRPGPEEAGAFVFDPGGHIKGAKWFVQAIIDLWGPK